MMRDEKGGPRSARGFVAPCEIKYLVSASILDDGSIAHSDTDMFDLRPRGNSPRVAGSQFSRPRCLQKARNYAKVW